MSCLLLLRGVFLDVEDKRVSSLLVTNTNPSIVEGSVDVAVPYRWVNAIGDIVILSNFPERVMTRKIDDEEPSTSTEESKEIDMIK